MNLLPDTPGDVEYLSSVSVCEAMIEVSLGKLTVADDFMRASDQFGELPVSWAHARRCENFHCIIEICSAGC